MAETTAATYQSISLDKISASPYQARKVFDEESIKGLAESMKQEGLIQPITVRKVGDGYELIAGERRWRAAKLLGWGAIDAIVRADVSDADAAIDGLIENLQREDLNPIEQAKGYQRLEAMNLTQEEISNKVGKSRPVIANMLALLDMPQEIQEIVSRETISETHARILRRIPDQKDQIALAKQAELEGWSVKETDRRVNELLQPKGEKPKVASNPPVYNDPLTSLWSSILMNPAVAPIKSWGVSFGPHEMAVSKGSPVSIPAWSFWLSANTATPRATLKSWFLALAHALGDEAGEQSIPAKSAEALAVTDRADIQRVKEEAKKLRLPQSPAEWQELEAVAAQGPGAVYAWAWGQDSLMAKNAAGLTWQALGETDPIAACHKIIESLEFMRRHSA